MAWTVQKLVYQAMSPVHMGYHTLGYIKLTRPYIIGRALWGAVTASLTRTFGQPAKATEEYQKFGKLVKENILLSYFYPTTDSANPLLPCFSENGLMFNKYTQIEFQDIFIDSTTQTAVTPDSNSAEDETLHESEFIRPKVQYDGAIRDVFFVGYLFMKEHLQTVIDGEPCRIGWQCGEIDVETAIREIFLGGDIKYGWGRLQLRQDLCGPTDNFFGNKIETPKNGKSPPVIFFQAGRSLPAHLCIKHEICAKGDIEPLVGRQWQADGTTGPHLGAGQRISGSFSMCWMPGAVLNKGTRLEICEYGMLKKNE